VAYFNEKSQSFICQPYMHQLMERAVPTFTAQLQSVIALLLVLISHLS